MDDYSNYYDITDDFPETFSTPKIPESISQFGTEHEIVQARTQLAQLKKLKELYEKLLNLHVTETKTTEKVDGTSVEKNGVNQAAPTAQTKRKGRPPKRLKSAEVNVTQVIAQTSTTTSTPKNTVSNLKEGEETVTDITSILIDDSRFPLRYLWNTSLFQTSSFDDALDLDLDKEVVIKQIATLDQLIYDLRVITNHLPIRHFDQLFSSHKFLKERLNSNYVFQQEFLKWRPEFQEAFNSGSAQFAQYFVSPDQSISKPFLSDQAIQQILNDSLSTLLDGDVIHVPFSPEETKIVHKQLEEAGSLERLLKTIQNLLPGRTLRDVRRYVEGCIYQSIPGKTFNEQSIVKYRSKPRLQEVKGMFKSLWRRETQSFSTREESYYQQEIFKNMKLQSDDKTSSFAIVECVFHPSEYKLAVASNHASGSDPKYTAALYDLEAKTITELKGHTDTVSQISFTNSGEYIVTGSFDKTIRVWSSTSGALCNTFGTKSDTNPVGYNTPINTMTLSQNIDNTHVAATDDSNVCVWDYEKGSVVASLFDATHQSRGFKQWHCVTYANGPFNNYLLAANELGEKHPGEIYIWDLAVEKLDKVVTAHVGGISDVHSSQFGEHFLSAPLNKADKVIKLWDMHQRRCVHTYPRNKGDINIISFSPCGRYIQAAGTDNRTFIFDWRFPTKPLQILAHEDGEISHDQRQGVTSAKWSSSGFLVTVGDDGFARFWDIRLGNPQINQIEGHTMPVNSVAISSKQDLVASAGDDNKVNLYGVDDVSNPKYGLSKDPPQAVGRL